MKIINMFRKPCLLAIVSVLVSSLIVVGCERSGVIENEKAEPNLTQPQTVSQPNPQINEQQAKADKLNAQIEDLTKKINELEAQEEVALKQPEQLAGQKGPSSSRDLLALKEQRNELQKLVQQPQQAKLEYTPPILYGFIATDADGIDNVYGRTESEDIKLTNNTDKTLRFDYLSYRGAKIAYAVKTAESISYFSRIEVIDLSSKEQDTYKKYTLYKLEDFPEYQSLYAPALSPNGSRIAFAALKPQVGDRGNIFIGPSDVTDEKPELVITGNSARNEKRIPNYINTLSWSSIDTGGQKQEVIFFSRNEVNKDDHKQKDFIYAYLPANPTVVTIRWYGSEGNQFEGRSPVFNTFQNASSYTIGGQSFELNFGYIDPRHHNPNWGKETTAVKIIHFRPQNLVVTRPGETVKGVLPDDATALAMTEFIFGPEWTYEYIANDLCWYDSVSLLTVYNDKIFKASEAQKDPIEFLSVGGSKIKSVACPQ